LITDPFNAANTQNCTYSHDDLVRLASVNCGASTWQQNFTYDPFGNITKTVPTGGTGNSFQPSYSATTNHISTVGSASVTYDANGDVTNDSIHTYTWDGFGNATTIDGIGIVYDALDRMVEQNRSSSNTEIIYSPTGFKMQIMNGSSPTLEFVPLPGGASAVYTPGGVYYRHSDWLGSSRFATNTPSRTVHYDGAYAPFGEPYAQTGTTDLNFTGMDSDTSAGLYDFLYREYSTQGRWPRPDPAGLNAVDKSNPQTWNRYAYVGNNPVALVDPKGTCQLSKSGFKVNCASGEGDGGGCSLDGVSVDCGFGNTLLGSGGASQCPANQCSGVGTDSSGNPVYAQYYSFAGGTNGYFDATSLANGINEYGGKIYSDSEYQKLLNAIYSAQVLAQFNRLTAGLSTLFGGLASVDPSDPEIIGGHANFDLSCSDISVCGPGRYDNGVHIEAGASGNIFVHDDTVSPWTGSFSFSSIFTTNFWEHGIVDLFGGQFCNCVFSH
jgi:RHS repeat-associated protein